MRTEPVIVIASSSVIARAWADKHLTSRELQPLCTGELRVIENILRGSRGRLIILVDVPDLGPYQYCGRQNTIITIQP